MNIGKLLTFSEEEAKQMTKREVERRGRPFGRPGRGERLQVARPITRLPEPPPRPPQRIDLGEGEQAPAQIRTRTEHGHQFSRPEEILRDEFGFAVPTNYQQYIELKQRQLAMTEAPPHVPRELEGAFDPAKRRRVIDISEVPISSGPSSAGTVSDVESENIIETYSNREEGAPSIINMISATVGGLALAARQRLRPTPPTPSEEFEGLFERDIPLNTEEDVLPILDEIEREEGPAETQQETIDRLSDFLGRIPQPAPTATPEEHERFNTLLTTLINTLNNRHGAAIVSAAASAVGLPIDVATLQGIGTAARGAHNLARWWNRFRTTGELTPQAQNVINTARIFKDGIQDAWRVVGGHLRAAAPLILSNQGALAVAALAVGTQLYRSGKLHNLIGKIPHVGALFSSKTDQVQNPAGMPEIPEAVHRYVKVLKEADKFLIGSKEREHSDLSLAVNIERLLKSNSGQDQAQAKSNAEVILNSIVYRAFRQASEDVLTGREKFGGELILDKVPPGRQVINPPMWVR